MSKSLWWHVRQHAERLDPDLSHSTKAEDGYTKYMLMIYGNHEAWNALDQNSIDRIGDAPKSLQSELTASGELIDHKELALDDAKIVRSHAGYRSRSGTWAAGVHVRGPQPPVVPARHLQEGETLRQRPQMRLGHRLHPMACPDTAQSSRKCQVMDQDEYWDGGSGGVHPAARNLFASSAAIVASSAACSASSASISAAVSST